VAKKNVKKASWSFWMSLIKTGIDSSYKVQIVLYENQKNIVKMIKK